MKPRLFIFLTEALEGRSALNSRAPLCPRIFNVFQLVKRVILVVLADKFPLIDSRENSEIFLLGDSLNFRLEGIMRSTKQPQILNRI